jgi:hypothetical protein
LGYDQYVDIGVRGKKEPIELLAKVLRDWVDNQPKVEGDTQQYELTVGGWSRWIYEGQGVLLLPKSNVTGITLPHSAPVYDRDLVYFDIVEFAKENDLQLHLSYQGEVSEDAERITVLSLSVEGQVKVYYETLEWVEATFTDDRKTL